MDAVSFTNNWIKSDEVREDVGRECVRKHHRNKFDVLDKTSTSKEISNCRNPQINEIFESQNSITKEELYSRGAPLGSSDDFTAWSARVFDQPTTVALEPQPIENLFISNMFINEDRILARDGSPIDVVGIFSWFHPRYSLLTDSCRALKDHRVSSDFSSCVKCGPGTGPTEDRRECKPCDQLVGHRYSEDRQFCVRCPPRQWPSPTNPGQCVPCDQLEGVRYSDDQRTCQRCPIGTTPSQHSTQCLDCSLPDHVLNTDTQRCLKCPEGSWPSTEGYDCSPCNLLDGVRYSDDNLTCVECDPGTTPTEDSTECLDCSSEYNFYTSKRKTRCAECPDGKGATEDHLGCHRIDGQWESRGSWSQ